MNKTTIPLPTLDGIVPLINYTMPLETPPNTDDDDNPTNWEEGE